MRKKRLRKPRYKPNWLDAGYYARLMDNGWEPPEAVREEVFQKCGQFLDKYRGGDSKTKKRRVAKAIIDMADKFKIPKNLLSKSVSVIKENINDTNSTVAERRRSIETLLQMLKHNTTSEKLEIEREKMEKGADAVQDIMDVAELRRQLLTGSDDQIRSDGA